MSVTITRDEWLSEFERVMNAQPKGDPGLTTAEIAEVLGVGEHRVNRIIRQALRAGRLRVGRKPTPFGSSDGRRSSSPCYQLLPVPKAAKRR